MNLPSLQSFTFAIALSLSFSGIQSAQASPDDVLGVVNSKAFQALRNFDYKKALRLWRHSANKGNANAQYQLGRMYQLGQGVEQSNSVAKSWYQLAAAQGSNVAKAKLSRMK